MSARIFPTASRFFGVGLDKLSHFTPLRTDPYKNACLQSHLPCTEAVDHNEAATQAVHLLNLSISVSGGIKINRDSPSSSERTGISP